MLSIDLGKVNSAYALIDREYQVLEWNAFDVCWPKPYKPEHLYCSVSKTN